MNDRKNAGWKRKLVHEFTQYWVNVLYLTLFFGVFNQYRRWILADYHIVYLDYGIGLINALVLAKVIMIGDFLRLGRGLGDKPLIWPTLYRTLMFSLWLALFKVVEAMVLGLLRGKGLAGGLHEFLNGHEYELLAGCLVIFFAFIPFFAFKELGRILGQGTIYGLFFRGGGVTKLVLHGGESSVVRKET